MRTGLDGATRRSGRLMVAPDRRGEGLGRRLLTHIGAVEPAEARLLALPTGAGSVCNLAM